MGNYKIASMEDLRNITSQGMEGGYIFKNKSVLENWGPLIETWIDYMKKICSEADGLPPYLDNEMGNVGLLMSAAWKIEGIAICEKIVKKNKDGKERNGRLDLWMKLPDSHMQYLIEAKHTYHLEKKKKDKNRDKYDYEQLKEKVKKEAGSLELLDNQCAVGIVFLTHNLEKYKNDHSTVEDTILDLLTGKIKEANRVHDDWDLVCWCFPKEMRQKENPGVIFSAKVLKGENKK